MPSLHNQGMEHYPIPDKRYYDCFLCRKSHSSFTSPENITIVITKKKQYDTITRGYVCKECASKLPTKMTRLATEKESNSYLERFMDMRFGKI